MTCLRRGDADCESVADCELDADSELVTDCELDADSESVADCELGADSESVTDCEPIADCELLRAARRFTPAPSAQPPGMASTVSGSA